MSDIAIRVEGLGKSYRIQHQTERGKYKTLQEDVIRLLKRPFRRGERSSTETFWALKDVSFEVKHGEVLGIIGRNGAGKSTLLKILSRITQPTTGRVDLYGRVGSLLEVGTGFHPELTGRENIYLNGAILGMSRREIQRRFDEIVDFAEIEQFLDTPVKRYSSGMYMRLAFAVAAHLEPEILVVDEVLAVGDAKFQEKCLGKMSEVARGGRTVLFVSHNMGAVQQLCERGMVLERGKLTADTTTEDAIRLYTQSTLEHIRTATLRDRKDRKGEGRIRFVRVEIIDERGETVSTIVSGQAVRLRFHYESDYETDDATVNVAFNVWNSRGMVLTHLNSVDIGNERMPIYRVGFFECEWERFNLRSGTYTCNLYLEVNGVIEDWLQAAFDLNVEDGNFFGTGKVVERAQGEFLVSYRWNAVPHITYTPDFG